MCKSAVFVAVTSLVWVTGDGVNKIKKKHTRKKMPLRVVPLNLTEVRIFNFSRESNVSNNKDTCDGR